MRPHLSVSQLGMLAKCGAMYEHRYVRGIKTPPRVASLIGTGTHGGIEMDLGTKLKTGALAETEAVEATVADIVREGWTSDLVINDEEIATVGAATDQAVSLATLHHAEVAPAIEPVALEEGFTLLLPGTHDLVGYIDIREAGRIRDTKTTGKSPPANAAAVSDQLTAYHLAAKVAGHPVAGVQLDHLVKTKRPKVVSLPSTRTNDDHARFLLRVEAAERVIAGGAFYPCARDSWTCCAKWCGYWETVCPHGSRNAVSVAMPAGDDW